MHVREIHDSQVVVGLERKSSAKAVLGARVITPFRVLVAHEQPGIDHGGVARRRLLQHREPDIRMSLDVFNIFNSDTVLTLRNNSSQVTATTPWAQTLTIVRPRTVQIGLRYQF